MLQQTHLLQQGESAKTSGILHQLQSKQQELTAQLQLAQHALTINILMQNQNNEQKRDRHRSDTYSSDGSLKENQSDNLNPSPPTRNNGHRSSSDENTPVKEEEEDNLLYVKQQCQWPGCRRECSSSAVWRLHMDQEHGFNEKSTAQARVQMQIISQLENQLRREKDVLTAMMKHLHPDTEDERDRRSPVAKRMKTESPVQESQGGRLSLPELMKSQNLSQYSNPLTHLMNLAPTTPSLSPLAALSSASIGLPATPTSTHVRHSFSDKSPYSQNMIPESHRRRVTHHDRGNPNLDPEEDLAKNREFYRVQDVRPPYTYAALIRAVSYNYIKYGR